MTQSTEAEIPSPPDSPWGLEVRHWKMQNWGNPLTYNELKLYQKKQGHSFQCSCAGLELPSGHGKTQFLNSTLLDLKKGFGVQCPTSMLAVLPTKPAVSFCPVVLEGCVQHKHGAKAKPGTVTAVLGTLAEVPDVCMAKVCCGFMSPETAWVQMINCCYLLGIILPSPRAELSKPKPSIYKQSCCSPNSTQHQSWHCKLFTQNCRHHNLLNNSLVSQISKYF